MSNALLSAQTPKAPSPTSAAPSVTVENCVPHARTWRYIREQCERREGKECGYPFCRCLPFVQEAA